MFFTDFLDQFEWDLHQDFGKVAFRAGGASRQVVLGADVNKIIKRNEPSFKKTKVTASKLRWDDVPHSLCDRYDTVICADCLFFDEYRRDLVNVIDKLLKPGGNVIIFAPSRGETFQLFKDMLSEYFLNVVKLDRYDEMVWDLHMKNLGKGTNCYDPDLHYPVMLTFNKQTPV
ncbi:hypothetical protein LSH36_17g10000 [Paralvinella palmiformis]|uniref:Calmodulin-lysine N-methyltransferase n=1 Tax=Paralvinella palmiformis TaxID=53620 RepID=A0AAD9NFJ5_9ANNE|nr:hypothetical protein LSH36_17g10000 [Paralvinella palmiformis]